MYYVKIDNEFRPFETQWEAENYYDLLDGEDNCIYHDAVDNTKELIISKAVDRYMSKKSKHVVVKS